MLLSERFTAGRLAEQVVWQPCVSADTTALVPRSRCGDPLTPGTRRFERLADAEQAARRQLRSDSSAAALHATAVFDLRFRSEASPALEHAIAALEEAHRLEPENAGILNDLAVAYLEQGERDQQLKPMLQALDAIERAVVRDPLLPSALFNRALILQRLYLVASAQRAWTRFLVVERHPGWTAEARAYARDVEKMADTVSWARLLHSPPVRMDMAMQAEIAARVKQSPQAARELGFPLLAQWGAAVARDNVARATRLLNLAREVGAAAEALGTDRSLSLAVHAIDAAVEDPARVRALARGHVDLEAARLLYAREAHDDAIRILLRSERALRSAGSPAARWAVFYRAAAQVNNIDYAGADRLFRQLIEEAGSDEHALVGKSLWALGLSQLRRGSYDDANRLYRAAVPHIALTREAESQGGIALLLAEGLTLAGHSTAGRAEAYRALRLLSPHRRSNLLSNHLAIFASYARDDGLSYAARAITDEMVEVARGLDRPAVLALSLCARARDLVALHRVDAAQKTLDEAMRWAARVEPGRAGDRVRAHVALAVGQFTRSRDPHAALPFLVDAVEAYSGFQSDLYLPTALYEASLAALATGDVPRAQGWLRQAVMFIEKQRGSFQTVEARTTFNETVENVFDAMIGIELAEMRPAVAFEMLERARMPAWHADGRRDASSAGAPVPPSLAEVGASLPRDMLLVEYALLHDRLVIWTASRRGTAQYTVTASRDSLAALVSGFPWGTAVAPASATDPRARLFDLLLRPLAAELGGIRQLTIVPDRELYRVPFAALWDTDARQYVVERYQVRTVPSAAFFLATSSAPRRAKTGRSALVVGDPALDPASAGALPRLSGAAREAATIAALYPGSTLLRGSDAGRGRVVDLLPAHSVFHFAGHAVFNGDQPELSYLALAPERREERGILQAWEIGRLRLSNLSLVVLSACSSLSPRDSRTGAVSGLAYSFLRAGAPATVSTLRDVDDGASTDLLAGFHQHLAAGTHAAEALRLAQVAALRSARPELRAPQSWAAFIYTGP